MIPLFKVRMYENAIKEAVKVLSSGFIGQGKVEAKFEKYLTAYFKSFAVLTNSATSAEHLIFHMLRDKYEGCEVLCTPLTCTATNWPVILNGYKIKWVDVDPANLNMDLEDLERNITENTKIVYFTHWGGYPINYAQLDSILRYVENKFGFRPVVVEDCAHALGATYNGQHVGTIIKGGYSTFSFQAIKHATSIDGGVLLLQNEQEYKRAKLLRWYGIDREQNRKDFRCEKDIQEVGFKFHMNDVCAAVGLENIKDVGNDILRRRNIASEYNKKITNENVRKIPYNFNASYWLYTIFVKDHNGFMEKMKEKNIMVSRVHERNDIHSCVKQYKRDLPNLDWVVNHMVCIPCGWWMSNEDVQYVIDSINERW